MTTKPKAKRKPEDPHEHLGRVDSRMARLMKKVGPCPLPERSKNKPNAEQSFVALVQSIVSQQLSGKAADTIYGRVEALGNGKLPSPSELLKLPDEKLRAAGLSNAKTRSVKDLASRVVDKTLTLDDLHAHDNEVIIERLTQVKGIGRWTAEMFLMFRLGRLDVLSTADLGLRKGMMELFGLSDLPDPETMEKIAAPWRPYRSVGCWYLWRAAEGMAPLRKQAKTTKKPAVKVGANRGR
ncbi:MAG: DNA-3-methyladenine glycosylase 2 family protein [Polyangiaceae bacterium]|nr:DNA-3-methyladenine glycosylase 2 family protein [Polyangiaceae bacterium]